MLFASRRKKYRYYTFYNSSLFACVFFPKICLLRQKTGFKCPKFRQKTRKSAFAVLRVVAIYLFFALPVVENIVLL
ncbi:MAG TPA: hypothetical protein DCY17_01895 [Clostridiales bacterium]|nr:hypothetical protein [Clostridiales bacterium]